MIASPEGATAVAPFEYLVMASGGTGDVLAGAIGALLAQGLAPFDAARLGVYLHGLAVNAVGERIGDAGLLRRPPGGAPDRPEALPRPPSGSAAVGGSVLGAPSTDPVPDDWCRRPMPRPVPMPPPRPTERPAERRRRVPRP